MSDAATVPTAMNREA